MRNRRFSHAFANIVRKLVAIVGLLVLASQVALGSVGAVFLCLCVSDEAPRDVSPCMPATAMPGDASCLHDTSAFPKEEGEEGPCADVLIKGADVESPDRLVDTVKVKASPALAPLYLEPVAVDARAAVAIRLGTPTRALAPPASAAFASAVRLLI